jgi:hypothetical protein
VNSDTLLLLQLYWRLDRRADGGIGRLGWIRRLIVGGVVVAGSALAGLAVGHFVRENVVGQLRADVIPGLLLALVLLGTTVSGFNQALQALYLSDDLEKLLVAPVSSRAVVTAKLLGRLPTVMFFLLAVAMPALLAFGFVLRLGPFYYMLGILLLLVAPLFGISIGALLAIFLVRLLPARRLSEWVGAASILIGTLLSIVAYLPRILQGNRDEFSPETEEALANLFNRAGDLPLPTAWAGRALVNLGQGAPTGFDFLGLLAYLLMTVGLFILTMLVADRLYLSGWLRMQSSGARPQRFEDEAGIFGGDSLDLMLGYKDWLLRVRDTRLLAAMFSGIIIAVFFVFFMFRSGDDGSMLDLAGAFGDTILGIVFSPGAMFSGMIYFVAWSSFSRVAASALSLERGAVYILKSAPISPSRIMRAKVFGVLIPFMLLATVLLIAGIFLFGYSALWTPYAWLVLLIMGFGTIAYTVSLDFIYPNLTWDDPRRMTNRKAGWRSLLGTALYSVFAMLAALITFVIAVSRPPLAIPIVLFGLGVLAGGTWFFVSWRIEKVEAAWPTIGAE